MSVLHSSDRAGAATAAYATGAYVAAYERAVFCLQPWGDTATRKGFYDAIAVGCIPVIFSRHGFESLEWMGVNLDELSILVPLANLTARGGALGYLSSLPRDKVVKLQASINSRRSLLQYGMRPGQPTRDAIDMLVSRVAKQLWRSARMARYAADNWPSWLPCDCKSFGWNRPQCATKIVAPGIPSSGCVLTKCVLLCTLNELIGGAQGRSVLRNESWCGLSARSPLEIPLRSKNALSHSHREAVHRAFSHGLPFGSSRTS